MKRTPIQNKKTGDDEMEIKPEVSRYIRKCIEVFAAKEKLTRQAAIELFLNRAIERAEWIRGKKL